MKRLPIICLLLVGICDFCASQVHSQADEKRGAHGGGGRRPGKGGGNLTVPTELVHLQQLNVILGRPTAHSIALSVLSAGDGDARVEYGLQSGKYTEKSQIQPLSAGVPVVIELTSLAPDTRYYYRLHNRAGGSRAVHSEPEASFCTQRKPGSTFHFALQGDSHPEREGKMFNPSLYAQTVRRVAQDPPDFYITLGDDFSLDHLMEQKSATQPIVDRIYAHQRNFLGVVGRTSALFLVNGNHEHGDRYLLDGTENNPAVMAGRARLKYYPLPAPDGFYTGDQEKIEFVGQPRDYYAWTWGDALFVVIDFYWHSPVPVDHEVGEGHKEKGGGGKGEGGAGAKPPKRDPWGATLGEAQYHWLAHTLSQSQARWKFVFCHHVLGTGRGGIECAGLAEWGGKDKRGVAAFAQKRPGWGLPIHDLMVKHGVTIFFQGHDHIFCRQELDGVVYQSCPNPADETYEAFNRDAYESGDALPNSGHIRVSVAPQKVAVDYIRSYLAKDATPAHPDGEAAYHYEISASGKSGKASTSKGRS